MAGSLDRMLRRINRAPILITLLAFFFMAACLPKSPAPDGGRTITIYGFSVMKEVLEKTIFPGFSAKWKRERGEEVHFISSFAGSETITNQILQGVGADIAILSIERDVTRLREGRAITHDWRALPQQGIVNKTPFVIIVRKGNPKNIRDFPDLAKPGVKLVHPDPVSSGGGQWSILAIYGSELIKTERQQGKRDEARALRTLREIWRNVISTPGSAREARTQFETGFADALITYELEGLLMKQAGAPVEVIVPASTIFSEHPAVVIDRNVTPEERPLIDAFMQYLWSEEAQRAFVQYHFRSSTNESFDEANRGFAQISLPFTVELFGGWERAYPDVIEGVWRNQAQKRR